MAALGPVAVVDLETTGLSEDPEAEILELGAVLLDPGARQVRTLRALLRPAGPLPRAIQRLTGLCDADVADAPRLEELRDGLAGALAGRVVVAHNAEFEQHFLARELDAGFARARFLDTLDLLAVTHPDAPDLRLESFTRMLLDTEEHHRALSDALDTARVMSRAALGARAGEPRFTTARHALEGYAPESPWLALLAKPVEAAPSEPASAYVRVGESHEAPVPFDEDAIASALEDEARGRRHFPGYRVRREQVELARRFVRTLRDDRITLLEGGTGVGKSLAYLAAAIPFAMAREAEGDAGPLVVSTRTRLLQDQLLEKDIGAAARLLGHPELRALSIKGRANYACERRLRAVLEEGREPRIFAEDRQAYAALEACARTRPHGEIGTVPAALVRRYPALSDLLRRAVTARAEQCSREQCASEPACAFGLRRAALARAHLVVANHDLLLRWPPDYPGFEHAIVDEAHELGDVADEVFALECGPEALLERFDEIFGRPGPAPRGRGDSLLPGGRRRELQRDALAWRRELHQDLSSLGRALSQEAGDFGDVDLPEPPGPRFEAARRLALTLADRLDGVADAAQARDADEPALDRALEELRGGAEALRLAFAESRPEAVAAFEGVHLGDRWRLKVRQLSPADAFHTHFVDRLRCFAGVSASLFVGGDAFAALGDLELEERAGERLERFAVPSPFPYAEHMRVVALRGGADLVAETSQVLESVAGVLGGRTLGLFTSLRRMTDVAEEIAPFLRREGIDLLLPRRASDDPRALVRRFERGAAVLLGARKFWQGLDVRGDALQAVVIEKLPFEVPTELRRRREARLKERGVDAFGRYTLGRMLLNLKQMAGRLIRSEEDRGIVVIVEGRSEKGYFRRLGEALPPGVEPSVRRCAQLPEALAEVGISGVERG